VEQRVVVRAASVATSAAISLRSHQCATHPGRACSSAHTRAGAGSGSVAGTRAIRLRDGRHVDGRERVVAHHPGAAFDSGTSVPLK
jgi:hypothetical protein